MTAQDYAASAILKSLTLFFFLTQKCARLYCVYKMENVYACASFVAQTVPLSQGIACFNRLISVRSKVINLAGIKVVTSFALITEKGQTLRNLFAAAKL